MQCRIEIYEPCFFCNTFYSFSSSFSWSHKRSSLYDWRTLYTSTSSYDSSESDFIFFFSPGMFHVVSKNLCSYTVKTSEKCYLLWVAMPITINCVISKKKFEKFYSERCKSIALLYFLVQVVHCERTWTYNMKWIVSLNSHISFDTYQHYDIFSFFFSLSK